MTDMTPPPAPAPTTDVRPATRWGAYLFVALAALGLGVGGTLIAVKRWPAVAPRAASTGSRETSEPAQAPDLPGVGAGVSDGAVYISPARQQTIGVRTAEVASRDLADEVKTVGTLAYDETRVTRVHTKIAGWIDHLFIDFVGKPVERGQPLFTIYSPDLVSTQQEYLLARKAAVQLGASRFEETRQGAASMLSAAKTRLMLWDVTDDELANLERTGEPSRTLTVYAPTSGVVLERNAFGGHYITPDMDLFTLADLSRIWAIGQLTEGDLARVRVGQRATVELTNVPGARALSGEVTFIYPDVDPTTRRGRVRVEVPNHDLSLRADAFVTLTIHTAPERTLAVPAEAVIDTGAKQYVILARTGGYFEPRIIETGVSAGGFVTVRRGLVSGDRVVTSAHFLIDSETNLQAAMQAMTEPPAAIAQGAPPSAAAAGAPHHDEVKAAAQAPPAPAADIRLRTDPETLRVGENRLDVTVRADGQAVRDASVSVTFFMAGMPAMGMPDMRITEALQPVAPGQYGGTVQIPMAGRWAVSITVSRGAQRLGIRRLSLDAQ
jgi:RND family efflux transporter MFP subunit